MLTEPELSTFRGGPKALDSFTLVTIYSIMYSTDNGAHLQRVFVKYSLPSDDV